MDKIKVAIVADVREDFKNEGFGTNHIYNDHTSKASVHYLKNKLISLGLECYFFGGIHALIDAYKSKKEFPNTIFFNLSDGLTQKSRKGQAAFLFELLNVPYVGSEAITYLLTANKIYTKRFLLSNNVLCSKGYLVRSLDEFKPDELEYPIILKPNSEGSSIGISQDNIVYNKQDAHNLLFKLLEQFKEILIEEFIKGYEISNFLIGQKKEIDVSEVIITSLNGKYYFDQELMGIQEKSSRKRKLELADEKLTPEQIDLIKSTSQIIFKELDIFDYARFDYRLTDRSLYFIEASPNPVLSETSELGLISASHSINTNTYLIKILNTALKRYSLPIIDFNYK